MHNSLSVVVSAVCLQSKTAKMSRKSVKEEIAATKPKCLYFQQNQKRGRTKEK